MNRRNEKQLPLSSPKTVKTKTVNKTQQGKIKRTSLLTFSVKKRVLDVVCREGRQQHLKNSGGNKVTDLVTVQKNVSVFNLSKLPVTGHRLSQETHFLR